MFHHFTCEVHVTFRDDEVIDWLILNDELDEEDAAGYEPTYDDLKRYAWECIENDDCEYDGCYEEH